MENETEISKIFDSIYYNWYRQAKSRTGEQALKWISQIEALCVENMSQDSVLMQRPSGLQYRMVNGKSEPLERVCEMLPSAIEQTVKNIGDLVIPEVKQLIEDVEVMPPCQRLKPYDLD